MTNQTPESVIAAALRSAGLSDKPDEFDSNIHSWRCEHPDRYGRCKCFEVTVADLVAALRAANMLREAGVPDAATAAIERVRALETFSITDSYPAWTAVDHDDLLAALDGAPEPEWEYVGVAFEHGGFMRVRNDQLVPEKFESWRKLMTQYPRVEILKRVKVIPAGPWLPVEGEKP